MEKYLKKRKLSLSVVVVEDHNDVLYHIYRAIGSKKIPFENGLMIHFDSHPDLVVPKYLDPTRIHEKDYVINCLSIENWIIPSVFAGHFNSLVWMKPFWAFQLDNGFHSFKVGVEKTSLELKVTCTQSYFVSEDSWCPENDLSSTRDVRLQVCTLGVPPESTPNERESPSIPSTDPLELCRINPDLEDQLKRTPFVLDIDLDFYSTRNPFYELFTTEQFDLLRKLYHYEHPTEPTEEALREVSSKRRQQLSELKSIFDSIRKGESPLSSPLWQDVQPLLATFPGGVPPNPDTLNDAGCTCDDCDLPHHVSTRAEVRHLVAETETFFKRLPKPAIITIARSSRDDYCPPEDVDFIQESVLEMLKRVYGDIEITLDYEDDSGQESQVPHTSSAAKD